MKKGGSKHGYLVAKHFAKKAVCAAKKKVEASTFSYVEKRNKDIFRIAKKMKESKHVVGECCVRGTISGTSHLRRRLGEIIITTF